MKDLENESEPIIRGGGGSFFFESPLTQVTELIDDCSSILRMLTLDDLWSTYILNHRVVGPDFRGLAFLAALIDDGIRSVSDASNRFEQMFRVTGEASLRFALRQMHQRLIGEGIREWPFDSTFDDVLMKDFLVQSCIYLRQIEWNETNVLFAKRRLIYDGVVPEPDLTQIWKCIATVLGLAACSVVASAEVLAEIGPVGAIAVGVAGLAGGITKSWNASGCGSQVVKEAVSEVKS